MILDSALLLYKNGVLVVNIMWLDRTMTAAAAVMPGSSSGWLTFRSVERSETTVFYQFLTIDLLLLIVAVNIANHSG